jgi:hypothetical protein
MPASSNAIGNRSQYYSYSAVFVLFLAPRFSSIFLRAPPPLPSFIDAVSYEKTFLYFHIVDLYIRIYLYIYSNLFFYVLFRHNTLFADTSNNIVLIIGIVFGVSLGPDEHSQGLECPVAVRSVTRGGHLSSHHQDSYVLLTGSRSPN